MIFPGKGWVNASPESQGMDPARLQVAMDLIPVKPLAELEPQESEMYRTRLPGIYQKIKP